MPLDIPIHTKIEALKIYARGHALRGEMKIFGSRYHVRLVRVSETSDIVELELDAPRLAREWFQEILAVNDGAVETTAFPGLPGKYLVHVFPIAA